MPDATPDEMRRRRALLVHNPKAGHGNVAVEDLCRRIRAAGFEVATAGHRDDDLRERLAGPDLVVIAGGDGTVSRVLRQMGEGAPPFTILPTGSANNLARSLGLTGGFPAGAVLRAFDIGHVSGPFAATAFAEAVGLGALAETLEVEDDLPPEERIAAGRRALAGILASRAPWHGVIDLDDQRHEGRWLGVEILTAGMTGPRLPLVPEAAVGDGRLDLWLLGEEDRAAMIDWLESGAEGPAPGEHQCAARIAFDWDGRLPLRIDDARQEPPAALARIRITTGDGPLRLLAGNRRDDGRHDP